MNPLQLNADQISEVNLGLTAVATVAAAVAAYCGLKGPSREDLKRVERLTKEATEHVSAVRDHTAATAKHVDAVREHTAATERHFATREKQDALSARAALVPIKASGSGPDGLPLDVKFLVEDPEVKLRRIDMLNRRGNPIGTLTCRTEEPSTFSVTLGADVLHKWFGEGDMLDNGDFQGVSVSLRAYIEIGGEETSKAFSISVQVLPTRIVSLCVSGGC